MDELHVVECADPVDAAKKWLDEQKASGIQRRFIEPKECEMRLSFDGPHPKISGYAAVFEKETTIFPGFREKVGRGAFAEAIRRDEDVRALWNHNADFVLGRTKSKTLTLREDDRGLYYEIIPPETSWAKDLQTLIKRGDVSQSSFGFNVRKHEIKHDSDGKGMTRTLLDVQLFDVSPVTFPAYPQTEVHVRMFRNSKECVFCFDDCGDVISTPALVEVRNDPETTDSDVWQQIEDLKKTAFRR